MLLCVELTLCGVVLLKLVTPLLLQLQQTTSTPVAPTGQEDRRAGGYACISETNMHA